MKDENPQQLLNNMMKAATGLMNLAIVYLVITGVFKGTQAILALGG